MRMDDSWTTDATTTPEEGACELVRSLAEADAVLIGAGAGLTASCGPEFAYSGERFDRLFGDFARRYHILDMYAGGFYPYGTPEEKWAFWGRNIWYNRYACPVGQTYLDLLELVGDMDYFVLTTNVDHQFQRAGFARDRLFYTQGDYGLFQCAAPCHEKTYDNREAVQAMVEQQRRQRVPSNLVPRCPVCDGPMTPNLRIDDTFVQDAGWHAACDRYVAWRNAHATGRTLYLELGVGANTPAIIKYPFWRMVANNSEAAYVQINHGEAAAPAEIASRTTLVNADIAQTINAALVKVR